MAYETEVGGGPAGACEVLLGHAEYTPTSRGDSVKRQTHAAGIESVRTDGSGSSFEASGWMQRQRSSSVRVALEKNWGCNPVGGTGDPGVANQTDRQMEVAGVHYFSADGRGRRRVGLCRPREVKGDGSSCPHGVSVA